MAVPVLDAVITGVRQLLPESGVVQAAREVISPEAVDFGDPVRAVDLLFMVNQLYAAMPPVEIRIVQEETGWYDQKW